MNDCDGLCIIYTFQFLVSNVLGRVQFRTLLGNKEVSIKFFVASRGGGEKENPDLAFTANLLVTYLLRLLHLPPHPPQLPHYQNQAARIPQFLVKYNKQTKQYFSWLNACVTLFQVLNVCSHPPTMADKFHNLSKGILLKFSTTWGEVW